ncbi:hypothetical protein LBMAG23_13350 [Bacteroidota bacterium]|nr:hypothetical protein LBMAG23_13350 [Bacteroidota bacterium]
MIEAAKIPRRKNSSVGFVRLLRIRLNDILIQLVAKFLKNRKHSYDYYEMRPFKGKFDETSILKS